MVFSVRKLKIILRDSITTVPEFSFFLFHGHVEYKARKEQSAYLNRAYFKSYSEKERSPQFLCFRDCPRKAITAEIGGKRSRMAGIILSSVFHVTILFPPSGWAKKMAHACSDSSFGPHKSHPHQDEKITSLISQTSVPFGS